MSENLIRYTTCKLIDNVYYNQWVSENTDTSKNTASLLPTSNQNGKRLYVYDSNQNKIVDIYLYTDNNYNLIVDDDGYCLYINNDTNIPQIVDCTYWNDGLWIVDENDNEITINNFSEAVENTIYEIDDNTWKYENTKIPEYEVTLYLFERETNIEDNLFEQTKISRIEFLTEFVNTIGYMSFSNCELLTSIDLPSSLTSIGGEAFSNCTSLVSVELPSSITSIENDAFSYCTSLTSIDLPSGLTSIRDNTFWNCISLTSIEIPNSVISIGEGAFFYCELLTSVTCKSTTPPTLSAKNFTLASNDILYVPAKSVEAYKASDWNNYFNTIEAIPEPVFGFNLDGMVDTDYMKEF